MYTYTCDLFYSLKRNIHYAYLSGLENRFIAENAFHVHPCSTVDFAEFGYWEQQICIYHTGALIFSNILKIGTRHKYENP